MKSSAFTVWADFDDGWLNRLAFRKRAIHKDEKCKETVTNKTALENLYDLKLVGRLNLRSINLSS